MPPIDTFYRLTALHHYAEDLGWMGILEQVTDMRYAFADHVFRYWVARASDPTVPAKFDPEASRRIARINEEAYLREREIHGTLTEGYIRDLCGSFSGQQVEGKRLGLPGKHVRLPMVNDVRSAFAFDADGSVHGKPADVELDLAFGRDEVWLGEVKRTSRRAGVGDVVLPDRKAAFLRKMLNLPPGPSWLVSLAGFEGDAREAARTRGIYASDLKDLEAIRAVVGRRRAEADRSDQVEERTAEGAKPLSARHDGVQPEVRDDDDRR